MQKAANIHVEDLVLDFLQQQIQMFFVFFSVAYFLHQFVMTNSDEGILTDVYNELQCPQVNMVDWLKMMVGNRRSEEAVDANIEVKPSTRTLKRALLTALRCVDPDSEKRPKMGQVVRMLESEEYPLAREVCYAVAINMIFICKLFFFFNCLYCPDIQKPFWPLTNLESSWVGPTSGCDHLASTFQFHTRSYNDSYIPILKETIIFTRRF